MKAVILVGGEGTRLRPLTVKAPKPMLPVVNRPFLELVIAYLRRHGIQDVILSMGYRSEVIEAYFGDGQRFGVNLAYVVESSPLGTAGGVKNVEKYIDGTFFVFNGDILTDLDLGAMLQFHRERGACATLALTPVDDPSAYGLVETDPDGRVRRFVEKPRPDQITTNLINAGTYILEPEILERIPPDTYYMFERGVFPSLLDRGSPLFGYPSDCYWIDIGTPARYIAVHRDVLSGRVEHLRESVPIGTAVTAGAGTRIDPGATIDGPVVLGEGVQIEAGARVRGPAVIGDGCLIGPESEVDGAILWRKVRLGARVILRECVIGNNATVDDDSVISGGAIVSDGCRIGCRNHLDRAVRIWPDASIAPNTISF
ncbi:MAG TPA: NDP-sugar synthase [Chloroflexota bacterium]|nr:NDP-sugar synthase [Chloroflexota bacterium]